MVLPRGWGLIVRNPLIYVGIMFRKALNKHNLFNYPLNVLLMSFHG